MDTQCVLEGAWLGQLIFCLVNLLIPVIDRKKRGKKLLRLSSSAFYEVFLSLSIFKTVNILA